MSPGIPCCNIESFCRQSCRQNRRLPNTRDDTMQAHPRKRKSMMPSTKQAMMGRKDWNGVDVLWKQSTGEYQRRMSGKLGDDMAVGVKNTASGKLAM